MGGRERGRERGRELTAVRSKPWRALVAKFDAPPVRAEVVRMIVATKAGEPVVAAAPRATQRIKCCRIRLVCGNGLAMLA